MSISTDNCNERSDTMAILIRFGDADDFDPSKMRARELAYVSTSNKTYKEGLYLCYAPGDVRRQTTEQDIIELLETIPEAYAALQQLLADLESNPSELTNILNNIIDLQSDIVDITDLLSTKLDKTGNSNDNIVTFAEAETDEDIASGDSHATIFGKILKSIKSLRAAISSKINKSDIVQSAEVADEGKVPSAAVINGLAQSVSELNNNFVVQNYPQSSFTFSSAVTSVLEFSCIRVGKEVILDTVMQVSDLGDIITSLPIEIHPISVQHGYAVNYDGATNPIVGAVSIANAGITVSTWVTAKIYLRLAIRWRLDI